MTTLKIEKLISADGWYLVRTNGSHHMFKKEGCADLLVIPNHGNKDLSIGVMKNLEKTSGLSFRR